MFSRFLALALSAASLAAAAAFTEVTNFGANPSNAKMFIYVPDKLPVNPAIIVGIHWCHGDAAAYYAGTNFAQKAESLGYIVIYPSVTTEDGCWDVSSPASLTHLGGGDSLAIHSMVQYTANKYNADKTRIFAVGTSSGAMMTNVLLGAYPDVFAAGSSWAGVPFGCFAGSNTWNSDCAEGRIDKTPQQWGDAVRAAYPGYTGKRPKLQMFHGTEDDVLSYNNFGEGVEQWTNVLGISATPDTTEANKPQSGMTRKVYGGGKLEAVSEQGQPHNLIVLPDEALRFFGLTSTVTPVVTPTPTTTSSVQPGTSTTASPATTTTPPPANAVQKWGQCGGIGHTGGTVCVSGSTCVKVNDWYSQCL